MIASLEIRSLPGLLTAAAFGVIAIGLLLRRRRSLPKFTVACLLAAIVLLVLAAGDFIAPLPRTGEVAVMIDLSPSTRSAIYRDRASLNDRLHQLLGSRSFKLIGFGEHAGPLPAGDRLADWPSQKTVFDPPAGADAILLLSDGRFDLPANAPPTFPVIDGGLIDPPDVAVTDAHVHAGVAEVAVSRGGDGGQAAPANGPAGSAASRLEANRTLTIDGAPAGTIANSAVIVNRLPAATTGAAVHRAEVSPGDAWPENDSLQFADASARARPRWWISDGPPPAGWQPMAPAAVPSDPAEFLSPSVIALSNVPAAELSPAAQEHLQQYVRDLGGSLLLLGGDHAFSLGGYTGSVLEDLSPLASDPPTPVTQWILLTDASGSMAGDVGGDGTNGGAAAGNGAAGNASRWAAATGALTAVVRELPPADTVSIGSFAADLRWWLSGVPVREARNRPLPPANAAPAGPTNLQPVLEKLVGELTGDQPKQLLVLTDGETTLDHADAIAAAMTAKHVRLHVLAIGNGAALPALRSIATTTGGSFAAELDSGRWLAGARSLVRGAMPDREVAGPITPAYSGALAGLRVQPIDRANRTWTKSTATPLAAAQSGGQSVPLIAMQRVGAGQVLGCAFGPNEPELVAMAGLIAASPRDPKYRVDWESAGRGKLTLEAAGGDRFLNNLSFSLQMSSLAGGESTTVFEQTGPGLYEAAIPPSAEPRLAKVMLGEQEIDRQPIAGRYAHEFDAIGLDRTAMEALATRTGGRVIGPDVKTPIDLPRVWRRVSLTPWCAAAAAALIAAALVHWKRAAN